MKVVIAAVVCLVLGWFAHTAWLSHGSQVPRVTVTVEPARTASVTPVVRPAPKPTLPAREARRTPVPQPHNGNVCNYNNGVLDTCAGNGYVTPGIGYISPPSR